MLGLRQGREGERERSEREKKTAEEEGNGGGEREMNQKERKWQKIRRKDGVGCGADGSRHCPEEFSICPVFAGFLSPLPAASASTKAETVPICGQGTQSALDKREREGGRDGERNRGRKEGERQVPLEPLLSGETSQAVPSPPVFI